MKVGRKALTVAVVWGMVLAVTGCQSLPPENPASWPEAQPARVELQPGDALQLLYTYWPELNTEQMVRPDGKISLQLVGDVMAAGKSPEELRAELLQLYGEKLREPEITVIVAEYTSHRVYVSGEVQQPGVIPIQGRLTALEAVMQAGGPIKQSAKMNSVVIVRVRDGQRYARSLNLAKSLSEPESEPFYLEPYDVVYVPRTFIDHVNQFVDQYIDEIIPRSVIWNMTYDLGGKGVRSTTRSFQVTPVIGQ